jgi:hypothetical protein
MKIAKSRLVNLFVHLGCPKAEKWSNEVLEGRVGSICELFDLGMPVVEGYRKLFEKVYAAVQNKEAITIVDDDEDPVDEPIQRVDTGLRMPDYETPVEQQERQKPKQKRKQKVVDTPAEPEVAGEIVAKAAKPATSKRKKTDYGQYLSEWGTWKWMPGYEIDLFFLAGGFGTIDEIAAATKRKRVSVQRHLLLLLRFGLVIWGKEDVFRVATREERIDFIDHGIKEKFRPMSAFVVRKPLAYVENEQDDDPEQDDAAPESEDTSEQEDEDDV